MSCDLLPLSASSTATRDLMFKKYFTRAEHMMFSHLQFEYFITREEKKDFHSLHCVETYYSLLIFEICNAQQYSAYYFCVALKCPCTDVNMYAKNWDEYQEIKYTVMTTFNLKQVRFRCIQIFRENMVLQEVHTYSKNLRYVHIPLIICRHVYIGG